MVKPIRFTVSSMMLLTVAVAVGLGWYSDHRRLTDEIVRLKNPDPRWDTSQLLGPPDTQRYGDVVTAWASKTPDGQKEWLLLDYPRAVRASGVWVYETYNPGAVYRVTIFDRQGKEHIAWDGQDPVSPQAQGGIAKITFLPSAANIPTQRIKVYVDSPSVPGWNEIDAVGLVGPGGAKQWAVRAFSSTAYGRHNRLPTLFW